jgi:Ca2+-binding RTX toxin-like protein
MRRAALLLMTMGTAILLASGVALAVNKTCTTEPCEGTPDPDILRGTNGNNTIYGDEGDDILYGQDGDDILGGHQTSQPSEAGRPDPGKDTFKGGRGKDEIYARDDGVQESVDCGEGREDLASFDKGVDMVTNCERLDWTYEVVGNPKCVKPWDNADVKCINGTKRDDELVGRNNPDVRKVDLIRSRGGNDTLRAGRGFDGLAGEGGDDTLYGGPGDDGLFGDHAAEALVGDEGSDELYAAGGDDFISALDKKPDTISCGGGDDDWAQIDQGIDTVVAPADCERVTNEREGFYYWWRKSMRRK